MLLLKIELNIGMRLIVIACMAALIVASCNSVEKSPDFVTYKTIPSGTDVPVNEYQGVNERYASALKGKNPGLDSLMEMQYIYLQDRNKFDITRYQEIWNEFRKEVVNRYLSHEELYAWIDLTGFLFQLTADALVAEELDRIAWQYIYNNPELNAEPLILPYVITRHTDNVHINLFTPAEIDFTHSLGGKVKITQETSFPESSRILVNVEIETKQYLELFVRIPSWATNAQVTVKGVKYLSEPGTYSKIAKKWENGDAIEVNIPVANLPGYYKPGQ